MLEILILLLLIGKVIIFKSIYVGRMRLVQRLIVEVRLVVVGQVVLRIRPQLKLIHDIFRV